MVPYVFSITCGESVLCNGELSFDGLWDVRDLSVSIEGNQLTRPSGEHSGAHGLGEKTLIQWLSDDLSEELHLPHYETPTYSYRRTYYEIVYTCVHQTHGKWPSVAVGRVDCRSASDLS